ncbi:MAG TPA: formate dehydrogenase accessory sulfurtransferase FdhD [Rudaea sp.]|nr:formate dehydrogenase accessory sulfurtransferase FdhD [Rudaea sp.]
MPSPRSDSGRRAGVVQRQVERRRGAVTTRVADAVAEEIPIAFVYNGRPHAVMMATPADLEDFALGFSLSEAIIANAAECERVDVVTALAGIELHVTIPPARAERLQDRVRELTGRTGCGLCGAQTLEAAVRHPPAVPGGMIDAAALDRALAELGEHQPINGETGAVHAAAWVLPQGGIAIVREDVGRHNALDKLIGAMQRTRTDVRTGFALVTSRASYEMVMKAATVGIGALAAISAPTALAIALAEEANLVLVGFARAQGCSSYTFPQRVVAAQAARRRSST